MFWALAQIKKDRERFRREGLELGREEGLEEGREDERARIERELAERGIEVPPEAIEIIRSPVKGPSRNGGVKD